MSSLDGSVLPSVLYLDNCFLSFMFQFCCCFPWKLFLTSQDFVPWWALTDPSMCHVLALSSPLEFPVYLRSLGHQLRGAGSLVFLFLFPSLVALTECVDSVNICWVNEWMNPCHKKWFDSAGEEILKLKKHSTYSGNWTIQMQLKCIEAGGQELPI